MGIGPFKCSNSTYESCSVSPPPPNPNPKNYKVLVHEKYNRFLILLVRYPDCTNFEGTKILVYENVTWEQLERQESLDPHFYESTRYYCPVARFVPTNRGWAYAVKFCKSFDKSEV